VSGAAQIAGVVSPGMAPRRGILLGPKLKEATFNALAGPADFWDAVGEPAANGPSQQRPGAPHG